MKNFIIVSAAVFSAVPAWAELDCSGQSDAGEKIAIYSAFNAYESIPPKDSVQIDVGNKRYGGYGSHGVAYAPGQDKFRQYFFGNNVPGEILFSPNKDANGFYVEIRLRNPVTGEVTGVIKSNATVCNRSLGIDGAILPAEQPFASLSASIEAAENFEAAVAKAHNILRNLVDPSPEAAQVYEKILSSPRLDWEKNVIPGDYFSTIPLGPEILRAILANVSYDGERKVALVGELLKNPKLSKSIANLIILNWDSFHISNPVRERLLEETLKRAVLKAGPNDFRQPAEYLAAIVFPDELGDSPIRAKALDLVFANIETEKDLSTLTLYISNYANDRKKYSDLDRTVIPRFLAHPNFTPTIADELVERIEFARSGTSHVKNLTNAVRARMLFLLLGDKRLSGKQRALAQKLAGVYGAAPELDAILLSSGKGSEKIAALIQAINASPEAINGAEGALDWLNEQKEPIAGAGDLLAAILPLLSRAQPAALLRGGGFDPVEGILPSLVHIFISGKAFASGKHQEIAAAILASPRLNDNLIIYIAPRVLDPSIVEKFGKEMDQSIRFLVEGFLKHKNLSDYAKSVIVNNLEEISSPRSPESSQSEWAKDLLQKIAR